jgi:acetyl-CoA carboxylase biotin carboxyl carrier protein
MSMIDLRYIKKLIEMLDASTVDSVEISSDKGMKLRLSKSPQGRAAVQVATPLQVAAVAPATSALTGMPTPAESLPAIPPPNGGAAAEQAQKNSTLLEVKSPMVGTYYASPEPGAKPYVTPGSRIAKGQVLCIIEAMKIMNEIESEFSGVVKEVLVQDAHPVEYGQILFRIDPNV